MNPPSALSSTFVRAARRVARGIKHFLCGIRRRVRSSVGGENTERPETVLNAAGFDTSGVIVFSDGQKNVYNVFEVALQAMIGQEVYRPYKDGRAGLKPRYYDIRRLGDPGDRPGARAALDWLETHGQSGPGDCLRWPYEFDVDFRGKRISAPWVSAFGQAYAVLAYLCWFRHTSEARWLDRAVAGAGLFGVPCADGGVAHVFSRQEICFEELPAASTHILNAHLISLLALAEVSALSPDSQLQSLLEQGLAYLKNNWRAYDTGYWSRYDLPDRLELFVRLCPLATEPKIFLGKAEMIVGEHLVATLDMADESATGRGDCRASGIDWGAVFAKDAFRGRQIFFGPDLHSEPVPTGTRQNTYLLMRAKPDKSTGPVKLELEFFSENATGLDIQVRDLSCTDLAFRPLRPESKIALEKGLNRVRLPVDEGDLGEPLSAEYHDFHITILKLLADRTQNEQIRVIAERFGSYR
ncbi:MAG: D-glucuronyl C5-epimerase family protein [Planctomycetota bacterium]|nr:D-glucuronyl C5-epimerase family protein [Planctomycetota bacterium]